MILVCGGLADSVTELMCARLDDCGYPYCLLDLGSYPAGFEVKWHWQGDGPVGYVTGPGWKFDLDELTGVYVRYLGAEGRIPLPNVPSDAAAAVYGEYDVGLMALLEDLPCTVINRVGGSLSNHSKTYQALIARQCGLLTPPTLVTNDPQAARDFCREWDGDVIYKSLSGVRSIVRRVQSEQLLRLPFLHNGPAQFQRFIPGENVRVHTVDDQIFATRVRSEAVDYRYAGRDGLTVEMEPVVLPPAVAQSCLTIARELGLVLAGVDLKETPEGDYYCFEVNPFPGFLYYERNARQAISRALAELLHRGNGGTNVRAESTPMR
jgi:glutathione synthase/RimK-type ligase-like ATP-grasp enzyme